MQVTQTSTEGLKQEFRVVLPAGDLAAKLGREPDRELALARGGGAHEGDGGRMYGLVHWISFAQNSIERNP